MENRIDLIMMSGAELEAVEIGGHFYVSLSNELRACTIEISETLYRLLVAELS